MVTAEAFAAVGRSATSANVSSSGESSYSIPIIVPPGTHGMTPQLASSAAIATARRCSAPAGELANPVHRSARRAHLGGQQDSRPGRQLDYLHLLRGHDNERLPHRSGGLHEQFQRRSECGVSNRHGRDGLVYSSSTTSDSGVWMVMLADASGGYDPPQARVSQTRTTPTPRRLTTTRMGAMTCWCRIRAAHGG